MMKRTLGSVMLALALMLSGAPLAQAQPEAVLLENVHLFDGTGTQRLPGTYHVLIVGKQISAISETPISPPSDLALQRLDGRNHTLIPGLIDAHWHTMLAGPNAVQALTADPGYLNLLAYRIAEASLLRGFTTVRDMGGPVFGLRRAIEEGVIPGPRIFPSGAMISQTGGHGDFRLPNEIPRASNDPLSHSELIGAAAIADGADEVLRRAREQLMLGATQLKLMAGGGVSSPYDPIDVTQYTPEEIRAAVSVAENWGTYVTVHAYTPRAVRMAIENGVRVIEHGQMLDEDTVRLMAERDIWWSLQPFLDDENASPKTGTARAKQLVMMQGTDQAYRLAREYGVRVAFGTDVMFSGRLAEAQGARLVSMQRWYSPGEILKMATGDNGQLLALSGPRYPYDGPLGVVQEGALADLLLVRGDPTVDITLLARPEKNLLLIMKDGRIYQNLLGAGQ